MDVRGVESVCAACESAVAELLVEVELKRPGAWCGGRDEGPFLTKRTGMMEGIERGGG
jgi:hypothetical protein